MSLLSPAHFISLVEISTSFLHSTALFRTWSKGPGTAGWDCGICCALVKDRQYLRFGRQAWASQNNGRQKLVLSRPRGDTNTHSYLTMGLRVCGHCSLHSCALVRRTLVTPSALTHFDPADAASGAGLLAW